MLNQTGTSHEESWGKFEIAWLYPAEASSPCDGMVHRWDEHQHTMSTAKWGASSSISTAKNHGSLWHKAALLACLDVESVKRNHVNHNLQIKIKNNKKGKDECDSSTHRPTSFTLGQLWRVSKNKQKNHANSSDRPKAFGQQSINGWKPKDILKRGRRRTDSMSGQSGEPESPLVIGTWKRRREVYHHCVVL